ncbi:MAG: hypothetical protein N2449_04195 [Bacteroidales bacterium]|nr:hypothetical protein [Bacteroidales bacterium]
MNKIYLVFIVITFGLLCVQCKKQTANKLDGTWRYWYLSKQDSGKIQYWEFREPNLLYQTIYIHDSLYQDTANWVLEKDFLEPTYLDIKGLGSKYDGIYRILKLNKKFLILQRYKLSTGSTEGAFNRMEFTRE